MKRSAGDRTASTAAPPAVDVALRRVREGAAVFVLLHFLTVERLDRAQGVAIALGLLAVNGVSYVADRRRPQMRQALIALQVIIEIALALYATWSVRTGMGPSTADWALLVLPVIDAAVRFRMRGAIIVWLAVCAGYALINRAMDDPSPLSDFAEALVVVLLVALPSGIIAEMLVREVERHRLGRHDAEEQAALLRAAALGGQRSSSLDVDEILGVVRETVGQMGFAAPEVFELQGSETAGFVARPVRQSRDRIAIPPGDDRLRVAAAARASGRAEASPPGAWNGPGKVTSERHSQLVAVPLASTGDSAVVVIARWPHADPLPAPQRESLEMFAAQAGASLHNAQTHQGLEGIKDRLAHDAAHDPLTELPNRRRFTEHLEQTCARCDEPDALVAVLFLDLDGFKAVNDQYGHDVGNELLVATARRLRRCVRAHDMVARMGGDEFTILFPRLTSSGPAVDAAQRVCDALTLPFAVGPYELRISTSVGIATAPLRTVDPAELLRRADGAMYRAKSQGKAGWVIDDSPAGTPVHQDL